MKYGFLIDMDGVIHKAGQMIPGADEFINNLLKKSIPFLFLTNNSRNTRLDVVMRLKRIGINVSESHIYTSSDATAKFLSLQKSNSTAYVLGEGGLLTSLYQNGFSIDENSPDYVIVGEGRSLTLEMVEKAIDFVLDGSKLIATNLDPAPKIKGWTKPGTGAIVAMIESATGKKAFSVGKPSPIMMRAARKEIGLQTPETFVIGDTMETDILGGVQMGYNTVLVLTGWSTREELLTTAYQPDLVVDSIANLNNESFITEILQRRAK